MSDPPSANETNLQARIRDLWSRYRDDEVAADTATEADLATLDRFLRELEAGEIAAATRDTGADPGDRWSAEAWVKRGVLLNFGLRPIADQAYGDVIYRDVLGVRSGPLADGTRNTPDGTVVRRGAHVADDVILMSPSFVNVGASVGAGSLVDSCVTVGSCAQIGANVKVGANTLIGGVLEPVENAPVVIEDGVTLGAGCRVTSGFVVGEESVVGENTLLTPRIPVYDLVEDAVITGHLPPERRAFTRFVESAVGEHDLFDGGAYKPAVVATDLEAATVDAVQREEVLRS